MRSTEWLDQHNTNIGIIPSHFDVVIIGGGPAGLLTAITLASANKLQVLVVEKKIPGLHLHNPSHAAINFNRNIFAEPKSIDFQIAGLEVLKQLIKTHNITCDPVFDGGLHIAHSDAEFKFLNKIANYNSKLLLYDDKVTSNLTSIIRSCMGSLYIPNEFIFDSRKFLTFITELLTKQGHSILRFCEAVNVKSGKDKITVHLDNQLAIDCKYLVYCTATTPNWLKTNWKINNLRSYHFAGNFANNLESIITLPQSFNYDASSIYQYDNKLYAGQLVKGTQHKPSIHSMDLEYMGTIIKNAAWRFGDNIKIAPSEVYSSDYYTSDDYLPIVGKISSNEYVNMAHGQSGFAYIPLAAAIISDEILGGKTFQAESKLLSPNRF